jgi:tetratricopeptide (TPR) repeat protein
MRERIILAAVLTFMALAALGTTIWRYERAPEPEPVAATALPVPPFPPRIANGGAYEHCLSILTDDPEAGRTIADNWAATGGGDGAAHCQGLALIATGQPALGAERLEGLGKTSLAPDLARATVLAQAAQARLMANQPARARDDVTMALALSPADTELLIQRAEAAAALSRWDDAVADLTRALTLDPRRTDALVMRAAVWRRTGQLDKALADANRAIAQDADNAEALLERGIERQRLGDALGARADWQRAKGLDPNSTTADLAEQNLALLEAGPNQR